MVDTDEFFANHMDLYDQAVRRWSECSHEEWLSGAEGKHVNLFIHPTIFAIIDEFA